MDLGGIVKIKTVSLKRSDQAGGQIFNTSRQNFDRRR